MAVLIGVISDTHGLVRPEALEKLGGSDMILHAGDIGSTEVLAALRKLAPVTAVRGNNDIEPWARPIPDTAQLEVLGISIYMLHDLAQLQLKPQSESFDVVICGHSHRPLNELRDGVLYFNPGSAGPRRFKLPVTVGMLEVTASCARGSIVALM